MDVERRCGLLRCRLSWLEKGHAAPTIERLEKPCDVLEIPLEQLFRDGEQTARQDTGRLLAKQFESGELTAMCEASLAEA